MKPLIRLAGLLLLALLGQLSSCATLARHDAQAPRGPVRRHYHRAERRNEHRRHRRVHGAWAGPDLSTPPNALPV